VEEMYAFVLIEGKATPHCYLIARPFLIWKTESAYARLVTLYFDNVMNMVCEAMDLVGLRDISVLGKEL
jgi:hypothetical protein